MHLEKVLLVTGWEHLGEGKTEPPVREAGGWRRHGCMGVPDGMGGDRSCVGAVRRLEMIVA